MSVCVRAFFFFFFLPVPVTSCKTEESDSFFTGDITRINGFVLLMLYVCMYVAHSVEFNSNYFTKREKGRKGNRQKGWKINAGK